MPEGFFSAGAFRSTAPVSDSRLPLCGSCGLFRKCKSPKMPAQGKGEKKILIIGSHPSKEGDESGWHFEGEYKNTLQTHLSSVGVDLFRDCWMVNSLICAPLHDHPTQEQIEACRSNITKTIRDLAPRVIILAGHEAVKSVIPWIWKNESGELYRWTGWKIPFMLQNAWVFPVDDPIRAKEHDVSRLLFVRQLKRAVTTTDLPQESLPYLEQLNIEIEMSPLLAAKWIQQALLRPAPISFDYETTCIKPETPGAKIVTCSVCWNGKRTIAFPWRGEAIDAMQKLLSSPVPKYGSNIKFEDRWTRRVFGHRVRAWDWDTMLAGHILDNRPGVTGVKFQSFVRFGVSDYASKIKPYFEVGPDKLNRVESLSMPDLLKYNGMDSLVQFHVAVDQKREAAQARGE